MSVQALAAARPNTSTPLTVDALRLEIDEVDAEILTLIERRQSLAGRIGGCKGPQPLKLNPGREARVISRLQALASPQALPVVEPVWRELMSAGLAIQQQIKVSLWPGGRDDLSRLARARFGARADYQSVGTPEEALKLAADGTSVAVLALRPESTWWAELAQTDDLWIFDAIGGRGPTDPAALVVGRVEASALSRGVTYKASRGGDSSPDGAPERLLGVNAGWRLSAILDSNPAVLQREHGMVGATGRT